jgi:uncharacterized protein
MGREETIKTLREHSAEIRERFGVKRLAVFGSTARDEALEDSDVDVLVEFTTDPTFNGYFDLKFFLEDLLERNVDLATGNMVRPEIRSYVERDLIDVFRDPEGAHSILQMST